MQRPIAKAATAAIRAAGEIAKGQRATCRSSNKIGEIAEQLRNPHSVKLHEFLL